MWIKKKVVFEEPVLRFVVASDEHYPYTGTEANILDMVSSLNSTNDLSFSVHNGDIVNDAPTELSTMKGILDNLNTPYYAGYGNHDHETTANWNTLWGYDPDTSFTVGDYAFILAASSNQAGDYLCPSSTFIQNKLAEYATSTYIFIITHIAWHGNTVFDEFAVDCPTVQSLIDSHNATYGNIPFAINSHHHDYTYSYDRSGFKHFYTGTVGSHWGVDPGYRMVDIYNGWIRTYYVKNTGEITDVEDVY